MEIFENRNFDAPERFFFYSGYHISVGIWLKMVVSGVNGSKKIDFKDFEGLTRKSPRSKSLNVIT